jgi:hypothetical protein
MYSNKPHRHWRDGGRRKEEGGRRKEEGKIIQ